MGQCSEWRVVLGSYNVPSGDRGESIVDDYL
jgi:hypothetical protein